MDEFTSRRAVARRLMPTLLAALLGGCNKADRRPPGLRLLMAKRAQMRAGMTVAEVDALMEGHPRRESRYPHEFADDRRLPRPSTLTVDYGDHVGANEGDYALMAYFDGDGKLMDTSINEIFN